MSVPSYSDLEDCSTAALKARVSSYLHLSKSETPGAGDTQTVYPR